MSRTANKRLVQKWESGEHTVCRANYRRALQSVTRTPYEQLGFGAAPNTAAPATTAPTAPAERPGTLYESRGLESDDAMVLAGEAADRLRFTLERPGQADLESIALRASKAYPLRRCPLSAWETMYPHPGSPALPPDPHRHDGQPHA